MVQTLDPWGHFAIEKYEKLFSHFGISPIDESIIQKLPIKHVFFQRKIVFGHRDFDKWIDALLRGEKVAVVTGFMPSGHVHLGHYMLFLELHFYQKLGASINIAIADAEAYAVRKIPRKKLLEYAREYILYSLAAGLDPKRTRFYFQTNNNGVGYYRLIQLFSRKITMAEMEAIYGELEPAKIIAALTQASDILHVQLPEYGGFSYVLVPVGADQDPHIRLTRDIADRFKNELGLRRPSSVYHKFIRGLDGNKMSSSRPEYAIFLSEDKETIYKKVMNALTGGRATAEEQRRLGGEPNKCTVYELYLYYLARSDEDLEEVYTRCRGGKLLCGVCKREAARRLIEMISEINMRVKEYVDIVDEIVDYPRF